VDTGEPFFKPNYAYEFPDQPERGLTYWDWSLTPVKADMGKVTALVLTVTEVTERIRAEAEKQAQQHLNQILLDALPDVALLIRPVSREVVAMNKAAEEVGCRLGRPCYEGWTKLGHPCPCCLAPTLWQEGTSQICSGEFSGRWWELHWRPVADDLYLHYGFDITEKKRQEESLRDSEEKYRRLVELSPDLIAIHDQKEIIYINPAGLKMLEAVSPDEVLGKNVLEFLDPEDHSKAIERMIRLQKEGGQSPLYEYRLITLKGRKKVIEVTGIPFTLGGRPAILIIAYDVTQRKQIERTLLDHQKARQKLALRMEEIEEMERKRIARTLHDLVGQKLATLNLHLDIFTQLLPEEIKRELSGRMDESRLLVGEITAHTREIITELRPDVLDDFGLVAALHWYGKQFSERTGIRTWVGADPLNYNMPPEMETIVFRIAQEALTNIAKHSRADQVEIRLVLRTNALELVISDNGLGFRFEGFYSGSEKGGWGLTFMKERAVNLGGDLQIESQPGKGTTVTLHLPIAR
jgi:PAS domain S-box-containing protein